MDHKNTATLEAPEAPRYGAARQPAQIDDLKRSLEEMQLRMSIVVYDRSTMWVLIDDIEMGCPDMSEDLRIVLTSARKHLELSERFEDAEYQVKRVTARSDGDERLQPLLSQVYKTWRAWQTAHSMCMHQLAGTDPAGIMRPKAQESNAGLAAQA